MSTKKEAERPEQLKVAYHEAGHAVKAIIVGRPIHKVTIAAANMSTGGVRLGACKIRKGRSKPSKDWLEDEALIFLAGMVAESKGKKGTQLICFAVRSEFVYSNALSPWKRSFGRFC